MQHGENNGINNRCGHVRRCRYIMQSGVRPTETRGKAHNGRNFCTQRGYTVQGGREGWEGRVGHMCKPSRPGDDVTSPVGCKRQFRKMVPASFISLRSVSTVRGLLLSLISASIQKTSRSHTVQQYNFYRSELTVSRLRQWAGTQGYLI